MKNNKGFVLVESIVAAIFVIGLSTFLILNILPLVGEYEKILNFDSPDSKYDAHLIRKMLLMDEACRVHNILTFQDSDFVEPGPASQCKYTNCKKPKYYYFENDRICDFLEHSNYCRKLLSADYLGVSEIIITDYSGSIPKLLVD